MDTLNLCHEIKVYFCIFHNCLSSSEHILLVQSRTSKSVTVFKKVTNVFKKEKKILAIQIVLDFQECILYICTCYLLPNLYSVVCNYRVNICQRWTFYKILLVHQSSSVSGLDSRQSSWARHFFQAEPSCNRQSVGSSSFLLVRKSVSHKKKNTSSVISKFRPLEKDWEVRWHGSWQLPWLQSVLSASFIFIFPVNRQQNRSVTDIRQHWWNAQLW